MPTYEYRCLKCKKKFEQFQRITDPALSKCVHCKGKVERLISLGSGFIFKGSGFYATDYKNKGSEPKKPSQEKKPPEKPTEGKKKESKDA